MKSYKGPVEPTGYTPWVRAIVQSVAGLEEFPLTTAESLQALRTVFACYRAAETKSVVPVG